MQTIGTSPRPSAACSLLLTVRSVSPNSVRRSEWPTITYSRAGFADHRRADLAGERALALPVQVLRGDLDVAAARGFAAACSAVNGGATTMSTPRTSLSSARSSLM